MKSKITLCLLFCFVALSTRTFAGQNAIPDCWSENDPSVLDGQFLARIAKDARSEMTDIVGDFRGEFNVSPQNMIRDLGLFLIGSYIYTDETREEGKLRIQQDLERLLKMHPSVALSCYSDQ